VVQRHIRVPRVRNMGGKVSKGRGARGRLRVKAQHGQHGKATVRNLLRLHFCEVVGVLGHAHGVKSSAGVASLHGIGLFVALGLEICHGHELDPAKGRDVERHLDRSSVDVGLVCRQHIVETSDRSLARHNRHA